MDERISIIAIALLLPFFFYASMPLDYKVNLDIKTKLYNKEYKCCAEELCHLCYFKEKECDCLEEIVNLEAPCEECIGKILTGKGNKLLKEYYVDALNKKIEDRAFLEKTIKSFY